MNPPRTLVHEFDTRQSADLTIFDGSRESESKLARQFWSSVLLTPPVESTLVCKEIHQRVRTRSKQQQQQPAKKTKKPEPAPDILAFQRMRDEAQRLQTETRRHQQLRQLFCQQSKANRVKHEQWALPSSDDYLGQTAPDLLEEEDRQLVCALPD